MADKTYEELRREYDDLLIISVAMLRYEREIESALKAGKYGPMMEPRMRSKVARLKELQEEHAERGNDAYAKLREIKGGA